MLAWGAGTAAILFFAFGLLSCTTVCSAPVPALAYTTACVDVDPGCQTYISLGDECEDTYTIENCRMSCHLCDSGVHPAPRDADIISEELVTAMREEDTTAATTLLKEAAALGGATAARLLYNALDSAHGGEFEGRQGRHAGLGPQDVEGYSSVAEQASLREKFHSPEIKTICETGFNAGHSAANYLIGNYLGFNVTYIGFDLGRTDYSRRAQTFLTTLFGTKFVINYGDSKDTLPAYLASHPNMTCDGIMVDGEHNYETSRIDLQHFLKHARCGSKVAIDDIEMSDLQQAWTEAQSEGWIKEENCESSYDHDATRNWCFATVIKIPNKRGLNGKVCDPSP